MSPKQLVRYDQIRRQDRVDVQENDALYQLGRYFEADCLSTDALKDMVYISADDISGVYQIAKVDITDTTKMPAVGMIVEKKTATRCLVQVTGLCPLAFTGLSPGKRYFVGSGSTITLIPPIAGIGSISVIQVVGIAISDTQLILEPQLTLIKSVG